MTTTKHIVGSCDAADSLFPAAGKEGQNVSASPEAVTLAEGLLQAPAGAELTWDLPDVFSIAYGSTLIGSATYGGNTVEFHFSE